MMPAIGMNGTPFCAGEQAGVDRGTGGIAQREGAGARTPAAKRGAPPASPSDTALVSSEAIAPAPIRRSACMPLIGTQISLRSRMPASISAAVAAIATPALSTGIAIACPGATRAVSASSETMSVIGRFPSALLVAGCRSIAPARAYRDGGTMSAPGRRRRSPQDQGRLEDDMAAAQRRTRDALEQKLGGPLAHVALCDANRAQRR